MKASKSETILIIYSLIISIVKQSKNSDTHVTKLLKLKQEPAVSFYHPQVTTITGVVLGHFYCTYMNEVNV